VVCAGQRGLLLASHLVRSQTPSQQERLLSL
jgi:hypothetical protein